MNHKLDTNRVIKDRLIHLSVSKEIKNNINMGNVTHSVIEDAIFKNMLNSTSTYIFTFYDLEDLYLRSYKYSKRVLSTMSNCDFHSNNTALNIWYGDRFVSHIRFNILGTEFAFYNLGPSPQLSSRSLNSLKDSSILGITQCALFISSYTCTTKKNISLTLLPNFARILLNCISIEKQKQSLSYNRKQIVQDPTIILP